MIQLKKLSDHRHPVFHDLAMGFKMAVAQGLNQPAVRVLYVHCMCS